ncbi:MAG: hypothetical protein K2W95_12715 [Candidatus Obscuribacterales bacterium]|nr:hypothetical protein [Candidatus Obscuribacterales bacterium]
MVEKKAPGKGDEFKRALVDFIFVTLLVTGAGFGGYFYGTVQRLAPVQAVPPGTPGALPAAIAPATSTAASPSTGQQTATLAPAASPASSAKKTQKMKYWLSSSGSDYIGYSITVKVNDDAVDNFFGPGKNLDITRLIKPGDNTVTFDAKALGADYNKHAGDVKSVLTVQVVRGPTIQEDFKESDVLLSYKRTAADSGDNSETLHLKGE